MDGRVTLYESHSDDLHVEVVARMEDEVLHIEGVDWGDYVKAKWDDFDYEYYLIVGGQNLDRLKEMVLKGNVNPESFLSELKKQYGGTGAFYSIRKLMDDHQIGYRFYTWV